MKNADPDTYVYITYGIRFDYRSGFSLPDGIMEKNFIIFEADLGLSLHIDN